MFCTTLEAHDPFFNLALEEVLLKNRKEEYFILGINTPSVIIGKHQSAHREADTKFVNENNIPVIRRISGGGTVFHDTGNLNFTFIRQCETGKQVDFRKHTQPVIDFLRSLGINAIFEGKNDIKVNGLKISGNAEHVHRNRVLHHGTLLFSSSLKMLKRSIRADKSCYTTRAVDSNPSAVMNLKEKLPVFSDLNEFSKAMMHHLSGNISDFVASDISQQDSDEAAALAESKYKSWEWNFAYGPDYAFRNSFMLDNIFHSCTFSVHEGKVQACVIEGSEKMVRFAKKLQGCRHMVTDFIDLSKEENIRISEEEIFNFF